MAGWEDRIRLIEKELRQRREEGFLVDDLISPALVRNEDDAGFWARLEKLPRRIDFPFVEPDALEAILPSATQPSGSAEPIPFERFHGALLGRMIGCVLGKPLEVGPYFWESTKEHPGWKNVRKWFEGADQYPIRDYAPSTSRASREGLYLGCERSQKEHLRFVESDDDVRYTILSLELLETKGWEFTSYDVGKLWHRLLPYQLVCTAETQAYLNFAQVTNHINPGSEPYSKEAADYVRTYWNPYREWIGAQIRIDGYAYAAAGDPMLAADLAYRDASFSHVKNGVYAAMFFASLIAAAFVEQDVRHCVQTALAVVPKTSRLYLYLQRTIDLALTISDLETLMERVWAYLLDYDPAHSINNSCICVAAILYGNGDFTKSVGTAVAFGLDTDCNGATVGSFVGALKGEAGIEDHWKESLHDTILSEIPGYHPVSIRELAVRYHKLYQQRFQAIPR
jgi:ADP-ribosylglycohydrolase